jgi:hypothetical protein
MFHPCGAHSTIVHIMKKPTAMCQISSVRDASSHNSPRNISNQAPWIYTYASVVLLRGFESSGSITRISFVTRKDSKCAKLSICQNVNKQYFQRDNTVYNAASCYVTQAIERLPDNSSSSRIARAPRSKQSISTSTCAGWAAMLRTSCITYTRKQWNFPNQSRSPVTGRTKYRLNIQRQTEWRVAPFFETADNYIAAT